MERRKAVLAPGILQADIYAGYNPLYEAGRSPGPVTEAACLAHSRRKFFDLADIAAGKRRGRNARPISPLALEAVKRIDVLFDIERGIVGKSATERPGARHELSAPVRPNWSTHLASRAIRRPLFGRIGLPKRDTDPVVRKLGQRIHHVAGTLERADVRYRDTDRYAARNGLR